jgi:hypothetical protein
MRPIMHSLFALALSSAFVACQKDDPKCVADPAAKEPAASATIAPLAANTVAAPPQTAKLEVAPPIPAATSAAKKTTKIDDEDEPQPDLDADLEVKRLVVAHGVKSREPVEPADTFRPGERIYAFVEVGNPAAVLSEVRVSFAKVGGKERGSVHLKVGESPRWRTWSYTELAKDPGEWEAIVRDGNGEVLARQRFTIAAPEAPAAPATKQSDDAKRA